MQHNSGVTFYTLPWTGVGTAQALPIVASQFDRWQGERGTICARQLGFKSTSSRLICQFAFRCCILGNTSEEDCYVPQCSNFKAHVVTT